MNTGKHIMAGMRIWPEDMHMGTFYGWVKPIADLSNDNRVSIILADAQSIENFSTYKSCYEATRRLRDILQEFLPKVSIFIETEQPKFELYTIQAITIFSANYYKRLGPFKDVMRGNEDVSFLKALYPCMMTANVLELSPHYILAKSGDQSPHIDVINDVIKKGVKFFDWPQIKVNVLGKQHIYIPNLTGNRPMRRNDPENCVTIAPNMNSESIKFALNHVPVPNFQGPEGLQACNVIALMWKSITRQNNPEALKACFARNTNCQQCKTALAQKIHVDLKVG